MGLLDRAATYPTEDLVRALVPNGATNLAVELSILLGASWLAGRGRLAGLLSWPGALAYSCARLALTAIDTGAVQIVTIARWSMSGTGSPVAQPAADVRRETR